VAKVAPLFFKGECMKFYRFHEHNYGDCVRVEKYEFELIRETPKGYWICPSSHYWDEFDKKWISKTSIKRYAYPTEEQALENFIKRKERQKAFLQAKIDDINDALELANGGLERVNNDKIKKFPIFLDYL
jgi:hypothetical protein